MAGPATILREIHRLQRHAHDLKTEIERIPRLLKGQEAKVARQEEAVREAQENLKQLKLASHDKESQLKSTLQLIDKHKQQREQVSSKKEYDALTHEIAADKTRCQELEDEILETLGQIEEQTARVPDLEQTVKQAKAEAAQYEKSTRERQTVLVGQLEQVQQQIKEVDATLPSDVRPIYERLVGLRGEDAMAAVQNRTCMACYTEITAQAFNDLMLSQFILCKSCGRVLYLPE
jgi:predicted  nucleic acid-binding Zn-ribbon protein